MQCSLIAVVRYPVHIATVLDALDFPKLLRLLRLLRLLLLFLLSIACNALQVLVDQVTDVAIRPVRSYSRRAATARQLFGITTAAVEQYAAHLHAAATGLLRVSQVVLAPSSVVQSGKTARHRRGESFGSPATSR